MDRFVTKMAEKAVLSPAAPTTTVAVTHKRPADIDLAGSDVSRSPKRAKAATDGTNSLPPFPSHSLAWQPAAQSFYESLPDPHRSPFVHLVKDIFDACNSSYQLSSSTCAPLTPALPPAAPTSPAVDMSGVLYTFLDVSFVQPRGKFDVHVTKQALILTSSGKQPSTIALPFTSLEQLVTVPDVNRKDECVLLGLRADAAAVVVGKSSMRQLLFKIDTNRKASDPKTLRVSQPEALTQPPPKTSLAVYFVQLLRNQWPVTVVAPDTFIFKSTSATPYLSCYHGTSDGHLYPLPAGLLFIQRPVVWLPLDTVDGIEVKRSGGGKTFDLKVGVRRSGEKEEEVVFGMISVKEQQALEWYVQYVAKWQKNKEKEKKAALTVSGKETPGGAAGATTSSEPVDTSATVAERNDDSDSEADSDFDPEASSDEEDRGGNAGDADSSSQGSESDSDDSQFNSDIDVDAEVSAEDIVKEKKRRTRAAQSTKPQHKQPSSAAAGGRDSDESEDEQQQSETIDGVKEDEELTSSTSEEESEVQQQEQQQEVAEGRGDMSRFRNVAADDMSKEESSSSCSSAEDDDVITIE